MKESFKDMLLIRLFELEVITPFYDFESINVLNCIIFSLINIYIFCVQIILWPTLNVLETYSAKKNSKNYYKFYFY